MYIRLITLFQIIKISSERLTRDYFSNKQWGSNSSSFPAAGQWVLYYERQGGLETMTATHNKAPEEKIHRRKLKCLLMKLPHTWDWEDGSAIKSTCLCEGHVFSSQPAPAKHPTTMCDFSSRGPNASSGLHRYQACTVVQRHTHKQNPIHIFLKNKRI